MSFDIVRRVRDLSDLKSPAKAVLLCLALRTNDDASIPTCWPSHALIAQDAGFGVSTVRRALSELTEAGYLRVEMRRTAAGDRDSNRYVLSMRADVRPERPHPSVQSEHTPPPERADPSAQSEHRGPPALDDKDKAPRSNPKTNQDLRDRRGPPHDDAGSRYRTVYAVGVSKAKGSPYAFPSQQQATWDLNGTIKTFAVSDGKPLRGEALLSWISTTSEAFASFVLASGEDPKFWSGFDPKGLMRWLNQGAPKRARPRAGERVKQPGGSTATWNKPIVAAAGDTPWDGTAPDDDSPPVPSPPPTTVRHTPATAGDDFWRVTFDDEPSGTVAT